MRKNGSIWPFLTILSMVLIVGCEKPAETPPPEHVLEIMHHIKDGYNNEDVKLLTSDFADIMFAKGFSEEAWRDTMKKIKKKLGTWKSEVYLGEKDDVYTWRGTFEKGKVKCVIVLNEDGRVSGLWFR
jgi:hypothetical protein